MAEANTAEQVLGTETELAVFAVGEGAAVVEEFGILGLAYAVAFVAKFAGDAGGKAVVDVAALDSAENTIFTVFEFDAIKAGLTVFTVFVVVASAVFVSGAVFEEFWD